MNRIVYVMILAVSLLRLDAARGDVLFFDNFDYPDGPPPSPWTVNTGIGGQQIVGGALVIRPGAAGADQNSPTGTVDYSRAFGVTLNSGTVFAGFDLNLTTAPTDALGNYFAHFLGTGGSANSTRVSLNTTAGVTTLGISEVAANAVASSATPILTGTTYRVVLGYDFATGTSTAWLNPVDISSASIIDASGANALTLTGFQFRIDNTTDGAKIVDNLVVATTFNEALVAVPEPSSVAMLCAVSVWGGIAGRRRLKARNEH